MLSPVRAERAKRAHRISPEPYKWDAHTRMPVKPEDIAHVLPDHIIAALRKAADSHRIGAVDEVVDHIHAKYPQFFQESDYES